MRTIKTALAVMASWAVAQRLEFQSPMFIVIAAIVSMQGSLRESVKNGTNRVIGTIMGAGVGLILHAIAPGNVLLVGLGVIVIIWMDNRFSFNKSIVISLVVFCSIMGTQDRDPLHYAALRVMDTTAGIVLALVINAFISPPSLSQQISHSFDTLVDLLETEFQAYLIAHHPLNKKKITAQIIALGQLIETYRNEIVFNGYRDKQMQRFDQYLEWADDLYHRLIVVQEIKRNLTPENKKTMEDFYSFSMIYDRDERTNAQEDDMFVTYNYQIEKIFLELQNLKKINNEKEA